MTSSSGRFTFCPGESVTLTCSLLSSGHVWTLSTSTTDIILFSGHLENRDSSGNILFTVTGQAGGNILTRSTMTFTASVDTIINGSSVFCGGAISDMPRFTFNQTVNIFGEKSVAIMCYFTKLSYVLTGRVSAPYAPTLNRTFGDYTSLTLTSQPPLYGHECVIGYTATGPNLERSSNIAMFVITGLNLCQNQYNVSMFARTSTGNGSEVTVQSSIPDFTGLTYCTYIMVSANSVVVVVSSMFVTFVVK